MPTLFSNYSKWRAARNAASVAFVAIALGSHAAHVRAGDELLQGPVVSVSDPGQTSGYRASLPALGRSLAGGSATAYHGSAFRVLGFTEREALAQSGDPDGVAFSKKHTQGDMANRWSHAAVAKAASAAYRQAGFSPFASALLGAAILVPKEFLIDRRPSASDLVIADYQLYGTRSREGSETSVAVSVFGDRALFFALEKRY